MIFTDVNEIYSRIFHHRQFISSEINYFLKEFEVRVNQNGSCDHSSTSKISKITILIFVSLCFLDQLRRNDKEVENLFSSVQNIIEAKDTSIEKCYVLSETNLPLLKIKLDESLTLCESVLNRGVNEKAVS